MFVLILYTKALYIALSRDKSMFPASRTCPWCTQEGSDLAERCQELMMPVKLVKNFITWIVA